MIDIAFSKLAIIGVAALVFIGPEKLPTVARMAGTLFGRAQRYINDVKSEVSREMELDELRKMQQEVQDAASEVGRSISQSVTSAESALNSAWNDTDADMDHLMEPPFEQTAEKSKNFRKKKLAATSGVPSWYKRQSGQKSHVISGAARMAKFRPGSASRKSKPFFH